MADLIYDPSSAILDTVRYSTSSFFGWSNDPVAEMGVADISTLLTSDDWQDRIRGAHLMQVLTPKMPDRFPALYQVNGIGRERHVWVAHPQISVLCDVLERYQSMWDHYTAQWGESSRRVFAVDLTDGVAAHRIFRPEATAQDILSSTLLTHDGLMRYQPPEVRDAHEAWLRSKREEVR